MIILTILTTTSLMHFSLKGWEKVHFELGSERRGMAPARSEWIRHMKSSAFELGIQQATNNSPKLEPSGPLRGWSTPGLPVSEWSERLEPAVHKDPPELATKTLQRADIQGVYLVNTVAKTPEYPRNA